MGNISGSAARLQGGCLCGAVRYEATADPVMTGFCYCHNCQKLSGSGHAFHAALPEPALRVTGATRGYAWKANSGSTVTTSFCPTCGSPIFGKSSGMPGLVTIRVASLDDPSAVAPQMAVFTSRKQGWDHLDPAIPAFPEMPPMPDRA